MNKNLLFLIVFMLVIAVCSFAHAQNVINDFETDIGNWKDPNVSGTTTVADASAFEISNEAAHTGTQSAKLTLINDDSPADGWFVRLNNRVDQIAPDSRIGFWIKGHHPNTMFRIVIWDNGTGGDGYEAGQWHQLTPSEEDWQWVELDLANDPVVAWITGNGEINSTDHVTIESIQLQCDVEEDVTLYIDGVTEIPFVPPVVIDDFETDIGNWKDPNASGTTTVADASSFEVSADQAYEGVQSGKLILVNDDTPDNGYFVRENNRVDQIAPDSKLSFLVRGTRKDSLMMRIVIWDNGTDGDGYEAGPWHLVSVDPEDWQVVNLDLARQPVEAWITGNGEINSTDFVTIESIQIQSKIEENDTLFIDYIIETPSEEPIPKLVINEIMQNPNAVLDNNGEYFEIFNAEVFDVDINGWIMKDADTDSHKIANGGPLIVPAGGYLVLGRDANFATNGGYTCDYQYPDWYLSNGADEIMLYRGTDLVDEVAYDGGTLWPDPTGAAMELRGPSIHNNDGANWYAATSPFGAGDLGSPGAANIPPNQAPIADAGIDQNVTVGTELTLDGSGSSDPDEDAITYNWTFLSGPENIVLADPTSVTQVFTAGALGDYEFSLVVNDGNLDSDPDTVVVSTFEIHMVEDFWVAVEGEHNSRGIGVNPCNGASYIADTKTKEIFQFNYANQSGTADLMFTHADFGGWLGPYGVGIADDGYVFIGHWTGAGKTIKRFDKYGNFLNTAVDIEESFRNFHVKGAGLNTEIWVPTNTGKIYQCTTTDGVNFTKNLLFTLSGTLFKTVPNNARDAVYVGSVPKKYDLAGNEDVGFVSNLSGIQGFDISDDDAFIYAQDPANHTIHKLDAATGQILSSTVVGADDPVNDSADMTVVGNQIFWSGRHGNVAYRGVLTDQKVVVANRAPCADAGPDQMDVRVNSLVTLDGSRSTDLDGDALTYSWTFASGPEEPVLSDQAVVNPTFTPTLTGDFIFKLIVNDGSQDSDPDSVIINVIPPSNDLDLAFEDDSDNANWGVFHEGLSGYTVVEHGVGEGVSGSNCIKFKDSGYGFFIERKIKATVGKPFRLTAKIYTDATPTEMAVKVVEITPLPISMEVHEFTTFTEITIEGYATTEDGYIQIKGNNPVFGAYYVYLDDLVYDDDAAVTTYTISGTVNLSDSPADLSGSMVSLVAYEDHFADTTDAAGAYAIANIVGGTYNVLATKESYSDQLLTQVEIKADATIDFTLLQNTPPVANAGADITDVNVSAFIQLDGTASSDADNDSLRYSWSFVSAPATVTFDDSTSATPGFRAMVKGDYTVQLLVNDGTVNSVPDTVVISITGDIPMELASLEFSFNSDIGGTKNNIHGVGVDPDGKIWVGAYGGGEKLQILNQDGTEANISPITTGTTTLGEEVQVAGECRGIAVAPNGNIIYSKNSAILEFNYKTGESVGGILWSNGSPTNPAVDNDGNIYVGQVVGSKVWAFNSNWESIGVIEVGYIGRAIEISADGGTLIAAGFNSISIFQGSVVNGFVEVEGGLPGPWNTIRSVDFDDNGLLWVCDAFVHNAPNDGIVYAYSSNLNHRIPVMTGNGLGDPTGIDFSPDGKIAYVIDFLTHRTMRWTASGAAVPIALTKVAADDTLGMPILMDSVLTVTGTVTAGGQFGYNGPAYIQNDLGTAGLAIYDHAVADSVEIGDQISVTGKVTFYRGLTEIGDVSAFQVMSSGSAPQPKEITCADLADSLGEALEGILVSIKGVNTSATEFPASGGTISVSDASGTATVYIDKDTDIKGSAIVAQTFDIVGIVGQYDSDAPYWQGYQIIPRSKEDLPIATDVDRQSVEIPTVFALHQNYPNPFNPTTTIRYDLPKSSHVNLVIYNMLGQQIKTLIDKNEIAGQKMIQWDGTNDYGLRVATGTYIMRIKAGEFVKTLKMSFMK